ncbi:MAG: diaminopimelate epimerase [Acidimicrobiia bacterium]|nr:diaminopimelate epimerase [Acidimicrobiia bacterium]
MNFVKMEGLGNDFVVVGDEVALDPALIRRLCDRRRGIGGDGLLQVGGGGQVVVMGYWNADGSPAEMCGNGLRCVTRYAIDHGIAAGETFVVATPAGERRVFAGEEPRVELGRVVVGDPFEFADLQFFRASVGNPHAVTFVAEVDGAPVATVGAALEAAEPAGVNVEFVHVRDQAQLEMRVWERGVGETLACGSGMVAAAAVSHHLGFTDADVSISAPGGTGRVELEANTSWLTGTVRYVFSGSVDL